MASDKQPEDLPIKGILKQTSSLLPENSQSRRPSMRWDELNIQATFHPPDKTYGHQKVDEPPTPYHFRQDPDEKHTINPEELASRLKEVEDDKQKTKGNKAFEEQRKAHYNEFQAVKLARHLLDEEDKQEKGKDKPVKK